MLLLNHDLFGTTRVNFFEYWHLIDWTALTTWQARGVPNLCKEDRDVNRWVITGVQMSCTQSLVLILDEKYNLLPKRCQGSVTYCGLLIQSVFSESKETVNQLTSFLKRCAKKGLKKMYASRKENVYVACRIILIVVTRLVEFSV